MGGGNQELVVNVNIVAQGRFSSFPAAFVVVSPSTAVNVLHSADLTHQTNRQCHDARPTKERKGETRLRRFW